MNKNYYICDFTRSNYSNLIKVAKDKYHFCNFTDFVGHERYVIWRHDVDASAHSAVRLAEIEAENNVNATYFLHLHSVFYNALEKNIIECFMKILNLGHNLGLHFDSDFYGNLDQSKFEYWLRYEAEILESIFKVPIKVFSFHNTTPFAMACTEHEYAGLINATSSYFREKVAYCSDSNGYWRFRRLEDVLHDPQIQRLQVLTHPEWWQEEEMSPRQRILRCIDGRAKKTIEKYDRALREFGRENVEK